MFSLVESTYFLTGMRGRRSSPLSSIQSGPIRAEVPCGVQMALQDVQFGQVYLLSHGMCGRRSSPLSSIQSGPIRAEVPGGVQMALQDVQK